jgi:subtilisin family serine protease
VFTADGDSYAAPIVAGVAAMYLERHAGAPPSEVTQSIVSAAVRGVVANAGGAPNLLVHVVAR